MEAARKAEVLHGVVRKMMAGGADIQTTGTGALPSTPISSWYPWLPT